MSRCQIRIQLDSAGSAGPTQVQRYGIRAYLILVRVGLPERRPGGGVLAIGRHRLPKCLNGVLDIPLAVAVLQTASAEHQPVVRALALLQRTGKSRAYRPDEPNPECHRYYD